PRRAPPRAGLAARSDGRRHWRCGLAGEGRARCRRVVGGRVWWGAGGAGRVYVGPALFVYLEVSGCKRRGDELRVRVASAIEREWLAEMFPHALHSLHTLEYDAGLQGGAGGARRVS